MGGRIKLIKDGKILSNLDTPDLGYEYDQPSQFDQQCGTFGLDPFRLPNAMCPDRFVCDADEGNKELQAFSQCIDAMNCHMMRYVHLGLGKNGSRKRMSSAYISVITTLTHFAVV